MLLSPFRLPALFLIALGTASPGAWAHGGGLDASGCHTNRKTGDYHCHGGGSAKPAAAAAPSPRQPLQSSPAPARALPPGCYVGPRGGTYTLTKSGRKNYSGC